MKKLLSVISALFLIIASAAAQTDSTAVEKSSPAFRFGYLSCDSAMHAMPEYGAAKKSLATLQAQYDEEMKRVEDEFNQKYETFLEGQHDFAPSILQKRQAELQELMEKNIAFKKEARRLMAEAEKEAMKPIKEKIKRAIKQAGQTRGLAFILNTDNNAIPYTDAVMGEDITQAVIRIANNE